MALDWALNVSADKRHINPYLVATTPVSTSVFNHSKSNLLLRLPNFEFILFLMDENFTLSR